jgi:hypothetical protein
VNRITVQNEPKQLAVVKIFTEYIQKMKKSFSSRPSEFRVISIMVGRIVNCQNNWIPGRFLPFRISPGKLRLHFRETFDRWKIFLGLNNWQ